MPGSPLLHLEDVFHRYAQRCPVPSLYSWREEYASEHVHDFFELRICAEGSLEVATQAGRFPLTAGDALLLRPGTSHICGNARLHTGYIVGISTELLHHELAWTLHDPMLSQLLWSEPQKTAPNSGHLTPEMLQHVQESIKVLLHNSWRAHKATFEPALRSEQIGHLVLLLSQLSRALSKSPANQNSSAVENVHPLLAAAVQLMHKDPAHDWSLAELTDKLKLERSYMIKLFRQTLGLPPMQYLLRMRLELAARLLTNTTSPAGEVAGMVGWLDQTLFCRHFRKRFGISPLQYRKRFQYSKQQPRKVVPSPAAPSQSIPISDRILHLEPAAIQRVPDTVEVSERTGFELVAMGRQHLLVGESWNAFPPACHGVIMVDFGQLTPLNASPHNTDLYGWQICFPSPAASHTWQAIQESCLRWIAWRGRDAEALGAAGLLHVPPYLAIYAANRVMDTWHKLVRLLTRTDPQVAMERQVILMEMLSGLTCPEGVPSHYSISG